MNDPVVVVNILSSGSMHLPLTNKVESEFQYAVVEFRMMIWTNAEYVLQDIRTVVRFTKWLNVVRLRITRPTRKFDA